MLVASSQDPETMAILVCHLVEEYQEEVQRPLRGQKHIYIKSNARSNTQHD